MSEKKFNIKCPLCSNEINIYDDHPIACEKCVALFKSSCNMICCDNCGYEFVPSNPKLIKFLKKMRKKGD